MPGSKATVLDEAKSLVHFPEAVYVGVLREGLVTALIVLNGSLGSQDLFFSISSQKQVSLGGGVQSEGLWQSTFTTRLFLFAISFQLDG